MAHGKLTAKRSIRRVPNGGTRQNMTASTGRDRRATWRYVCRVPPCGTRYRCKFAVCLTEAHGKIWRRCPTVMLWPRGPIFAVCRSEAHGKESFCRVPRLGHTAKPPSAVGFIFGRVFCIWPTTKALFAVCPMVCARRTLRHTANYRFPVVYYFYSTFMVWQFGFKSLYQW